VYRLLGELATAAIDAGRCVIIDATFLDEGQRVEIEDIAKHMGVSFQGVWLKAPAGVLHDRVRARTGDASDATVAVVEAQETKTLGKMTWQPIDASQSMDAVAACARGILQPNGLCSPPIASQHCHMSPKFSLPGRLLICVKAWPRINRHDDLAH
jgi:predicted kinase